MTHYRVTFILQASEIDDFTRLGVCSPPQHCRIETIPAMKAPSAAAPGVFTDGHYYCACNGCWACPGHVKDCTCGVNWDKLYSHE